MAVVQSGYNARISAAVAGMVANQRDYDTITRLCEDATLAFGVAVGRGTDGQQCSAGGTLGTFFGATVRDVTLDHSDPDEVDKYITGENVAVLTRGEVWVQVSGTPGPSDAVHYDASTGVFAASGGTGPVLGARWMETSANGLGRLFLSGYGQAAA